MKRLVPAELPTTYYNGWSEGSSVVLLRRDPVTGKRYRDVIPFEWYFYITAEDYKKVAQNNWDWLLRHHVDRVIPDQQNPDKYYRVYVQIDHPKIDHKYISSKIGDPEARFWCAPYVAAERSGGIRFPRDRERWKPLHHVLDWCQRKDITPLEADLTPKQRYLIDNDLRLPESSHVAFVDIETDDTVGGFDRKEKNRILSIAWEGSDIGRDPEDRGFVLLAREDAQAEREMLLEFRERVLKVYDVVVAWNGYEFDFPVIIARTREHRIKFEWRQILFADLLPIFKKRYLRAGADAGSYSLDSIGDRVLGMRKIDWRAEFRRRRPGVLPKFINLYRYEPELLEEYNRYDVEILRKLEEFTGFLAIEHAICRIAGLFANDFAVSTKIDAMMLRKGRLMGHHFPTRFWSFGRPDKFEGAYVFPPVVGMHSNVAAFDFKALYPSMIRAFNISPETLVKAEQRTAYAPEELCTCPCVEIPDGFGTHDLKGGSTYRRDVEGYVSQMFVQTTDRRKQYTDMQSERLKEVGTTDDDLYKAYNRMAYAYKQLGLSFYGDLGNPRSRYYDVELAEAVTLSGRFFIQRTAEYARECGFEPLYGDTDSLYVQLAPSDRVWVDDDARVRELVGIGEQFVAYCQERFLQLLGACNCNLTWNKVLLEFEDIYDRIFFVSKKRYAGRLLLHKGDRTDNVEVKGLEIMRSDVAGSTRALQQRCLDAILMNRASGEDVRSDVIDPEYARCASGGMDVDEITISKGLSKEPERYKTQSLHVKLAKDIRATGREFFVGMKVEYVVTAVKPNLSGVTREQYESSDGAHQYAAEYYWDRVIYPASMRILTICYPGINWAQYLIESRRKRVAAVERYRIWLLDPKRRDKAIAQIRANVRGVLLEEDLQILRESPRVKRVEPKVGKSKRKDMVMVNGD